MPARVADDGAERDAFARSVDAAVGEAERLESRRLPRPAGDVGLGVAHFGAVEAEVAEVLVEARRDDGGRGAGGRLGAGGAATHGVRKSGGKYFGRGGERMGHTESVFLYQIVTK